MQLLFRDNLPFLQVTIALHNTSITIGDVLMDTGSASTILAADVVASIGLTQAPEDMLHAIGGIGGTEFVYSRKVDYVQVGSRRLSDFTIEVGGMDYGFEINGILGMDFLTQTGAIINLRELQIKFAD